MLKIFKKASIIVLSFIVVLVWASTLVNASDYSAFGKIENKTSESNDYLTEIEEKSQYLDVFEIESLREAGVKHFRLEDGSYRAISYGQVVHQKDADGKWQDIDNTLSLNNGFYKTGDERVSFSQNVDSLIPFYELNKEDFSLSFSVSSNPIRRVIASVDNQNDLLNELDDSIETISKIKNNSHISYEGIYEGVSLDFYLYANTISMMLSFDSTFNDNQVKFILETENVEAKIVDGCLVLIDPITSIIKYRLLEPYLGNSDVFQINDNYYSLSKICEGKYEIEIVFDLDDSSDLDGEHSRISPRIGPEIFIIDDGGIGGTTRTVYDTYISSSAPSTNYGYSSEVKVSLNNSDIGLIKIDNPTLPLDSTIVDAYFSVPYYYSTITSNGVSVAAYQVLSNWLEESVTWNSSPSISQTQLGSAVASGGPTSSNPGTIALDVTSLAKKWYSDESNNYGIACKHIGGTATTVLFKSWENHSERATLTIDYSLDSSVISNGTYFIKNGHLNKFMQIDDGDSGNNYNSEGAILELWTGTCSSIQKWIFKYLHNGYYKIESYESGKAVSVHSGYENTGGHALRQETYNGSYRQQWSITFTSHGMYKIKPRSSEGYSTDWVMCCGEGIGGNGRNVEQRAYSDNSVYKDEWILYDVTRIYGTRGHRVLTDSQRAQINCHGYSMLRNDWPYLIDYNINHVWFYRTKTYVENYVTEVNSTVKQNVSQKIKLDFEEWLNETGYSWYYESDFTLNGQNVILEENQYRVVLRSGIRIINGGVLWDYHFWYQIINGTWSNKHGNGVETNLGYGVTPFSNDTSGWDLGSISGFYDGNIYCYVITIGS